MIQLYGHCRRQTMNFMHEMYWTWFRKGILKKSTKMGKKKHLYGHCRRQAVNIVCEYLDIASRRNPKKRNLTGGKRNHYVGISEDKLRILCVR